INRDNLIWCTPAFDSAAQPHTHGFPGAYRCVWDGEMDDHSCSRRSPMALHLWDIAQTHIAPRPRFSCARPPKAGLYTSYTMANVLQAPWAVCELRAKNTEIARKSCNGGTHTRMRFARSHRDSRTRWDGSADRCYQALAASRYALGIMVTYLLNSAVK